MRQQFPQSSQENQQPAFLGQGPIPLRDFQMQSPDQFEDVLRKMKNKQEKDKQTLLAKERTDQKSLQDQRDALKKMMERNENKQFTYDYDGKILVSRTSTNNKKQTQNPDITAGVSYKISSTTVSVPKKGESKIASEQPPQPVLLSMPKAPIKKESLGKFKNKSESEISVQQSQDMQSNQVNTYEMMMDNIKPSAGVVFKGSKGEVKVGEGYSGAGSGIDFTDAQHSMSDVPKRMTKKEYDLFIRNQGNFSRIHTFNNHNQNNHKHEIVNSNHQQQQDNANNHINNQNNYHNNNILDSTILNNSSIVSPNGNNRNNLQMNDYQQSKVLRQAGVAGISGNNQMNNPPVISSFQTAGIQSINKSPSIQSYSKYGSYSQQHKAKQKQPAGNIQVADQEKLHSLLLC